MHNYTSKNLNALFNNLLNKAFLLYTKQTFFSLCFILFVYHQVNAQSKTYLGNNLTIAINTQSLSRLSFKDSTTESKYNYRFSKVSIGYKHTLYDNFTKKNEEIKFSQVSVLPALQVGKVNFGNDNLDRVLINLKLSLLGIFHTSNKSTFLVSANVFANEDEYTLPDALLRYSGIGMYIRKVNTKFSYRTGLTLTYLFGEPLVLPILGFKYQTGKKSNLNVTLPFVINWKKQTKIQKLIYGFTLKPNGGINRYQNKLSVDTTNVTLMLRQRSFQLLGNLRIINNTNMILFNAGIITNQKVMFTNENDKNIVNGFSFNGSNSIFANVSFIWFLNKKAKPNNKNIDIDSKNIEIEDELSDEIW